MIIFTACMTVTLHEKDLEGTIITNFLAWGEYFLGTYEDAGVIYDKAQKYGYEFFRVPPAFFQTKEPLKIGRPGALFDISEGLHMKRGPSQIYIKVEDYMSLLKIEGGIVITCSSEAPIKTKIVEGEEGIDKAFYLRILLNLAEDFGIDEITCYL